MRPGALQQAVAKEAGANSCTPPSCAHSRGACRGPYVAPPVHGTGLNNAPAACLPSTWHMVRSLAGLDLGAGARCAQPPLAAAQWLPPPPRRRSHLLVAPPAEACRAQLSLGVPEA